MAIDSEMAGPSRLKLGVVIEDMWENVLAKDFSDSSTSPSSLEFNSTDLSLANEIAPVNQRRGIASQGIIEVNWCVFITSL